MISAIIGAIIGTIIGELGIVVAIRLIQLRRTTKK